jgi:hypothetical protein
LPSGKTEPSASGNHSFRGHVLTAHTLACLRFADPVTEAVARLTTGSDGLTPSRAGFAPAGRQTKFQGDIALPPIPIDQQSLVALFLLSAFADFNDRVYDRVGVLATDGRSYLEATDRNFDVIIGF